MSIFNFKGKSRPSHKAKELDQAAIDSFVPSYVWPSEYIPFRKYYESKSCRIFMIENLTHNWKWLKESAYYFRDTDFFYVSLGWYYTNWTVSEIDTIFSLLGLNKNNFIFMFNSYEDKGIFNHYGFSGELINHNCFLNADIFQIRFEDKIYDAIYVSRLREFKRHYLASRVNKLALIVGGAWEKEADKNKIPPHTFINNEILTPEEVAIKISESRVGLILSGIEGACYASSEYLLSGLPVVSTWSKGGRDIWYNDYNSIVCDPNEDAVAEAVTEMKKRSFDSIAIRKMHITLANEMRKNFIHSVDEILEKCGDRKIGQAYFNKNFTHKMFVQQILNYKEIFIAS